jgi:hypothetical protein
VITVGFCRGRDLTSKLIGWFGGGYYSHVTTLLPDRKHVIDSRADEIDGVPSGVQVRPLTYLKPYTIDWVELPASNGASSRIIAALKSQLGRPYDEIGIYHYLTGAIKDRNWSDETAWFCDELAVWSWMQGPLLSPILFPTLEPNRITPGGAALIAWSLGAQRQSDPRSTLK